MTTRKTPQEPQHIHWCGTINGVKAGHEGFDNLTVLVDNGHCNYVCASAETAPTTGTPHVQWYLQLKKKLRMTQVVKLLQEVFGDEFHPHCEACKGSPDENINYVSGECEKKGTKLNETFVEFGNRPGNAGKRERDRYRVAYAHSANGRFDLVDPDIFMRHFGGCRAVYNLRQFELKPLDGPCGIWLWGKPGCGKSHYARVHANDLLQERDRSLSLGRAVPADAAQAAEPARLFGDKPHIKACNKWMDGYPIGGDDVQVPVVLDDIGLEHTALGYYLKIWADKYPFSNDVKGGTLMMRPIGFVVTSNYHPSSLFSDSETLAAILRRYKVYECFYDRATGNRTRVWEEGTGLGEHLVDTTAPGTVRTFNVSAPAAELVTPVLARSVQVAPRMENDPEDDEDDIQVVEEWTCAQREDVDEEPEADPVIKRLKLGIPPTVAVVPVATPATQVVEPSVEVLSDINQLALAEEAYHAAYAELKWYIVHGKSADQQHMLEEQVQACFKRLGELRASHEARVRQ